MSSYLNATVIPGYTLSDIDPTPTAYLLETATPEVAKRVLGQNSTHNLYLVHIDLHRSRVFLGWGPTPSAAIGNPITKDGQVVAIRWRSDRGETGPETITIESFLEATGL